MANSLSRKVEQAYWAILMGRNSIYISIHEVISKLDPGKIILQKKIKIVSKDNYQSVQLKIEIILKIIYRNSF